MIKRTLFFGNPVYLTTKNDQIVVSFPDKQKEPRTIPIEDVGMIIIEHTQVTISSRLLEKLVVNNASIVNCNQQHMPIGLLMPLVGHSEQNERFRVQLDVSVPLKKKLWQQTIQAKILNQGELLSQRGVAVSNMKYWAKEVSSGDTLNHEARAAAYFWKNIFGDENFRRHRVGDAPNNLLNYGYAILRAVCARSIIGSGMMLTLGIHHANKYNAFCLADDIMEPYRPFVDELVCFLVDNYDDYSELTIELKTELLQIPAMDVVIDGKKSPLLVAMSRTTNSLYQCFEGTKRKILYPKFS